MASEEEPMCKRPKKDVFSATHENRDVLEKLRVALQELQQRKNGFCLLKVTNCNAELGVSFSHAFCNVSRNSECASSTSPQRYFSYRVIYQRGIDMVKSYMEDPANIPEQKGERIALKRLLEFLTDFSGCERALKKAKRLKETDWTTRLAHHFLSKLSVNQNYIIDNHDTGKEVEDLCFCCNEKISGQYGDTSIGSTKGWHGYVDILLGVDPVPVQVAGHEPESPTWNESSSEIISDDMETFRQQILAETIVFSFLTKKRHEEYSGYLIPTIAITGTKTIFYFYDCVKDVLLESSPLPIFTDYYPVGETLSFGTIFALWLTVNFQYFCHGTPASIIDYGFKADFLTHIKTFSSVYFEDVKLGCGSGKSSHAFFEPDKCLYMIYEDCDEIKEK